MEKFLAYPQQIQKQIIDFNIFLSNKKWTDNLQLNKEDYEKSREYYIKEVEKMKQWIDYRLI